MRTKSPLQVDKILDAAGRLFGTQRFHEVRMEDIAAEAEVGKGTLYRYFSDKEELYLELLERSSRQFVDRLAEERTRARGPREQLQAIVSAIIAFFDERPHLFDLIQRAEVLHTPERKFPWQDIRDELIHLFHDLFEEGKAQGEWNIRDSEVTVLLLLGGLRSIIRFGQRPRPRDLAPRIVEAFLKGADPSPKPIRPGTRKSALLPEPARV